MSPKQSFCAVRNASTPGANMIEEKRFRAIVRPRSLESKIVCFDRKRGAYRINVKAPAENNRANRELMRFLSKKLKRRVRIVSGLKSRIKIIES